MGISTNEAPVLRAIMKADVRPHTMSSTDKTANCLYRESSPYLLQHADNPVNWLAWNKESLALAEQTNKPILLSIGYSACHWCHVMAHESFEDNKTAEIMNRLFINIKVDKEERPDLDKIYQNAHSLLTQRPGGWPLTVFLTPDTRMPIFAGTYFPPEPRHGLPAFKSLLTHISDIWSTRQNDIAQQSSSLQSTYQRIYEASKPTDADFNTTVLDLARNQVEKQFDIKNGGFSGAPKFPHPAILEFAIKHWVHSKKSNQPDPRILHCAVYTLEKMANGGIFDHLGGGFCRYSTDDLWMIPHFEKMLYDNGPLLSLYSQAWKLSGEQVFFDAASETADWVIREMQSADGGFYSAQDADSEGTEGKYFVWSHDEINSELERAALELNITDKSVEIFRHRFGIDRSENFEGKWHLHGYFSEASLAKQYQLNENELNQQLKLIRKSLFTQRDKRIHPGTDTKILCAWNGLMIHGMSIAGRLLDNTEYTDSAIKAAYFIKNNCWNNDRLYASIKDGSATLDGYIDDYAFLIYGLLEVLQNRWDNELYDWALQLADRLIADFEDSEYGGFFFTSHDHENLIQRIKSFSDDAIPSGNAIAAFSLNRLGCLSGNARYIESARNCLRSAWTSINHAPISHCALLNALSEYLSPPNILIMRTHGRDKQSWPAMTQQYHLADTQVYNIPAEYTPPASLHDKVAGNTSLAYPCNGQHCLPPLKNDTELHDYVRNNSYRILE